ncbi:Crp/Fnr family transcriptional regulator [Hymenobacter canadensis]|uniref:Crp/Fnr family transcriptional regulator n=1 Tax=Hymenobacter canadensis TaxID=2999067 RepID=A0ABY7LK50_9BACT|nr:Crp/Fnr family transcriptional regulator [Hymenobacter canadensis]WBA40820.1 Crp/Fnr family transcriptional regulator [Hymenobacter canadensis]
MVLISSSAPSNCQNCRYVSRSLLGTCQLSELAMLSDSKVSQYYQRGQIIFQHGNRPAGLYCIHQGRVKVSKLSSDGKEQILSLRKEGDVLGFQPLCTGGLYDATAVALTDCVVCLVPRPDFYSLLEQNSRFSHALMRRLSEVLSATQQQVLHTAYKPVRERLAEALVLLYHFFRPETPAPFSIPISRDDLAALTSTAKETASRLLSELRDEGLVATQGSRIMVLDLPRLQKMCAPQE